eukprot:CAMPEP_0114125322 /NCGR_PEP_ID=MMETSP0043_2-20121206/9242_1 /TAXON_ID=464988 /ORGANISM="Hemiselmis andersenii, Strain CCMP644" /LENGTH=106 /DNA_ID=CAMNT_0001218247 /DNA_START=128 /DNA_END=448 /DNA_ORIENTATION=+
MRGSRYFSLRTGTAGDDTPLPASHEPPLPLGESSLPLGESSLPLPAGEYLGDALPDWGEPIRRPPLRLGGGAKSSFSTTFTRYPLWLCTGRIPKPGRNLSDTSSGL